MSDQILLGTYSQALAIEREPDIRTDDAALRQHLGRGYFTAYLAEQLGLPVKALTHRDRRTSAKISKKLFGKHAFCCGATGSGKSRAITATLRAHLEFGASVVRIEPKYSAVLECVAEAQAAGLSPDQIIVVSPRVGFVPGWNPFLSGLPVVQVASDLTDILMGLTGSSGPRMSNICQHVLILVGVHPQLSLVEAVRALQRPEFLERLLGWSSPQETSASDRLAHQEAVEFFRYEFLEWSKGERATAVGPLLTRLAEVLRVLFLLGHLCAEKNHIDLPSLWSRQTVLIFHLDFAVLGTTGVKLLAGLVASMLLRTAMRMDGSGNVLLIVDEAALAEAFLGKFLVQILAIARSQGLSVLIACQHFQQLTDDLRNAVLSQPAVVLLFRLGYADARPAATSLAASSELGMKRLDLSGESRGTRVNSAAWRHIVQDQRGCPLQFRVAAWEAFEAEDLFTEDSVSVLYRFAHRSGIERLYVCDPASGSPIELRRYIAGLPLNAVSICGPSPIALTVRFPKPKVSAERLHEADYLRLWIKALQELPVQHAVLKAEGHAPGVIRLVDVPDTPVSADTEAFLHRALSVNGQSEASLLSMIARRRARVNGHDDVPKPRPRQEDADGSIF